MEQMSSEYKLLFNGITTAISELQSLSIKLAVLQQKAEEQYIQRGGEETKKAC